MTPTAPAGLMTAEEFGRWCQGREADGRRFELYRGVARELFPWPIEFAADYRQLLGLLTDYVFRQQHGSVAMLGDGLIVRRTPDTVRRPAAMLFLTPTPADDFPLRFTSEVPTLVVDFDPPDDPSGGHATRRLIEYIHHGAGRAWLVAPDERSVIVARPGRPFDVLDGDDDLSAPDVLPGFAAKVSDLFTLPGGPPAD